MSKISRRQFVTAGLAATAGVSGSGRRRQFGSAMGSCRPIAVEMGRAKR